MCVKQSWVVTNTELKQTWQGDQGEGGVRTYGGPSREGDIGMKTCKTGAAVLQLSGGGVFHAGNGTESPEAGGKLGVSEERGEPVWQS